MATIARIEKKLNDLIKTPTALTLLGLKGLPFDELPRKPHWLMLDDGLSLSGKT